MLPESIDDYVPQDHPVRAYDAFGEKLDLKELGINEQEVKVGNPAYNPRAMIKLIVYGCSYGIRSSRKLERACYDNMSFIWLMEGLKPDHKTISEARKNNKEALKNILKQSAQLCIKLDLIEGNTLFVDGSKIRGNASINNTFSKERAETLLKNIDKRIEQILDECDSIDEKEQNNPSLVKLKAEFKDSQKLKTKVEQIMKDLNETKKDKINSTDPECVNIKGRQGTHAGYNGQIVVDEKHGIIVNSDVVNENHDKNQFTGQIEQANRTLGKQCESGCADAGYANTDNLKESDDKGIRVIVPTQKQATGESPGQFDKERFIYDSQKDCYICPEGHEIPYNHFSATRNFKSYRFCEPVICRNCKHFGICTKSKRGRTIVRLANEDTKNKLEKQYEQSKDIFRLRKQKVELPFGHFKHNLGVSSFLLRGIEGVRAEMSILSSCFNIARMITIFGVSGFIEKVTMA